MAEMRLCIGTSTGPRSTVWKVITRQGDVYIISRLMGSAAKVSLHQSGQGQWSFTSRWAQGFGVPSRQRHIDRWEVRQPAPNRAALVFRLLFPFDELRTVGPPAKAASVTWVLPPPAGRCAIVEVYLAPQQPNSVPLSVAPFPVISLLPRNNEGSLVLLRNEEPVDGAKLALIGAARARMAAITRAPRPQTKLPVRAALLVEFEDHTRGFIEVAPVNAAA